MVFMMDPSCGQLVYKEANDCTKSIEEVDQRLLVGGVVVGINDDDISSCLVWNVYDFRCLRIEVYVIYIYTI
jgi:hypothetical protein